MHRFKAAYWIQKLGLSSHVEGGAYARSYTAELSIPKENLPAPFAGDRPVCTAIYFLLEAGQFSALHRIASDELWHFYYGDPLIIYSIEENGQLTQQILGNNPDNAESLQCLVKAGNWFGSKTIDGGEYSLVGCTVSPGFDFADFVLAERSAILNAFPQHQTIIEMLTRTDKTE